MELSLEEGMNILRSWESGKNRLRFLARERLAHANVGAVIKEVSDDFIDLDTGQDDFFHLSLKDATFARHDSTNRPPAYLMQDPLDLVPFVLVIHKPGLALISLRNRRLGSHLCRLSLDVRKFVPEPCRGDSVFQFVLLEFAIELLLQFQQHLLQVVLTHIRLRGLF
jgi:hypothetical protein